MIVFDVDDTMYDLMWPFYKAYEQVLADRTTAGCEELFLRSRINADIVLEKEKQGLIKPEDAFYQRMKMTCEDVGVSIAREECEAFEKEYRYFQTRIELFDFMKEILDCCREKQISIAFLTNGNRRDQGKKYLSCIWNNGLKRTKCLSPEKSGIINRMFVHFRRFRSD